MKKGRLVKRSIGIVLILLFAAACLVAVFDKDSNAAAPKKVKIGVLNCLTSWYAGHDIPNWNEVQAVGEMINERGGITVKGEKYQVDSLLRTARARSTASRPRPIGWSLIKTSRSFLDREVPSPRQPGR